MLWLVVEARSWAVVVVELGLPGSARATSVFVVGVAFVVGGCWALAVRRVESAACLARSSALVISAIALEAADHLS